MSETSQVTMLNINKQIETLNAIKMILGIWVIAVLLSRNICDNCDISIVHWNICAIITQTFADVRKYILGG